MRKDIPEYPGYCVDDSGYVISKEREVVSKCGRTYTIKERMLKPSVAGKGYMSVSLCRYGVSIRVYIHRLVAELFVPNPNNYNVVNHIDGNKNNNSASNLEWCSYSENNQHAYDTGLHGRGDNRYRSKLSYDDVKIIKHKYFIDGCSIPEICKMFPVVHRASIHDILKGKTWKHLTDY